VEFNLNGLPDIAVHISGSCDEDGRIVELRQTDGVAMGPSPSPVTANFYMEDYEKAALESAPLKPRCWFRYVDDAFVIWQHGPDKLKDFLHHLNSIHQSIQFTKPKVKATSHSWTWIFTEDRMALWVTKCTASPLTPISTSTPSPIIIHPISKRCYSL
jgi:hypothetical protein